MSKKDFLAVLFLVLFLSPLIIAIHVVTTSDGGTTFSANESTNYTYNISVNNSDAGNITQINITIPVNFTFTANTNGTNISVSHTFSNTSTILTWTNATEYLLNGTEIGYFWFNASSSNPGTYNFTIQAENSTNISITNLSVTINDTIFPQIQFVDGTEINLSNLSKTYINYNVTATDTISLDTINASLWNSTYDLVNSSTNTSSPLAGNFAGLSNGTYYLNATANDSSGNINNTLTRTITIGSTTGPVITLYNPADLTSSATSAYNFTFNVTDANNTLISCELFLNGVHYNNLTTPSQTATNGLYNSSISAGAYTWVIGCADSSGNLANGTARTLTITSSSSSSSSSGGGGSGGDTTSSSPSEAQLAIGYVKTGMYANYKILMTINSVAHTLRMLSVNSTNAKIRIESVPQEATFEIGEEKKFDLGTDNIYDLSVTLDAINQPSGSLASADLTVKTISEAIGEDTGTTTTTTDTGADTTSEGGGTGMGNWWWISGIIIVLVLLAGYITYLEKFKKKRNVVYTRKLGKRKSTFR